MADTDANDCYIASLGRFAPNVLIAFPPSSKPTYVPSPKSKQHSAVKVFFYFLVYCNFLQQHSKNRPF
jgi:hypothetical protein